MILAFVDEAVAAGAREEGAGEVSGLSARTLARWRAEGGGDDRRIGPGAPPAHKLSEDERQRVLDTANSVAYRELSPRQIVPLLADAGQFVASESTFYRVLRAAGQLAHRSHARPGRSKKPAEHIARGPDQVWSWDITYLRSALRGAFHYLYLVVDVYSRKIVGWAVHDRECAQLAGALVKTAMADEGVDAGKLVLHADNGGPMKGRAHLGHRLRRLVQRRAPAQRHSLRHARRPPRGPRRADPGQAPCPLHRGQEAHAAALDRPHAQLDPDRRRVPQPRQTRDSHPANRHPGGAMTFSDNSFDTHR